MSITFPTTLDTLTNPAPTDLVENAILGLDHDQQHSNANDAIEALEAKVGANSSAVTTSHDYKLSGVTGTDKAVSKTGSETLTNKTLTLPVISSISNGGTVTIPSGADTLVTLTSTGTLTNKTLTAPSITLPTITKPIMDATNPSAQTYSPAGAGTATLDLGLANEHRITMPAGNITIALTNDTNAQKFIVSILQDGVGSRTVTWFTTIRWASGGTAPTLTTTASKRDTFGFIRTGSGTYDGFVIGQNI